MDERQETGAGALVGTAGEVASQPVARRLALEEIHGDWLTAAEFAAWSGISRNSAYELLRQDPLRQHVQRFGRMIRVRKAALMRLVEARS